mmetsp:Transcript_92105/g.260227  ORF Transcript_92105/g.260227 Transcript_92105/m.260227 type:complete len:240 (+) Transcript_92105:208-927(+)
MPIEWGGGVEKPCDRVMQDSHASTLRGNASATDRRAQIVQLLQVFGAAPVALQNGGRKVALRQLELQAELILKLGQHLVLEAHLANVRSDLRHAPHAGGHRRDRAGVFVGGMRGTEAVHARVLDWPVRRYLHLDLLGLPLHLPLPGEGNDPGHHVRLEVQGTCAAPGGAARSAAGRRSGGCPFVLYLVALLCLSCVVLLVGILVVAVCLLGGRCNARGWLSTSSWAPLRVCGLIFAAGR